MGPVWTGYLGLILYGAATLSIGLFASSLSSNQIVSAVVGFGILLILTVIQLATRYVGGPQLPFSTTYRCKPTSTISVVE